MRVYLLPHAGGSAGSYAAWARALTPPGLRFVPVELPGRGTRLAEAPLTSMDEAVDGIVSVLESRPPQERFLLFGHSMGAQIAYETTRRLAESDRPLPQALLVSGCRPPGAPQPTSLHERDDQGLLEGIVELGGTPAQVLANRDLMEMMLPVIRADLTLLAHYARQTRPTVLPCPVVAYGGTEDRLAGPEWITGWRSTTAGPFHHRLFPGEHFFLHDQMSEVIADIAAVARGASAATGG
ncbi:MULTISPECIES: thioesterase II family protein [Streptomyces]|uniref:Thioesterase domain-containing protein n=1 Tax=Streptomyces caniscabiei TaxID=2746961 RepID=A0ABU4N3R5_9ACTN|nr:MULTISPECIES: alpha/beta fold hydrolase [Streptomyces]MBE4741681.1 thioesterase [Streptomyces caniscabiei]MBE4762025.1 thioesterase [Streptomyces caniscabiei]MBE4775328.1 thioesterase [Streptomyces caniscabiei]MBE4790489.1 thioesterase [Streptomyces caniscabiei]MBE4799648.1 thioesterase [Streptomyces caniscabiei]